MPKFINPITMYRIVSMGTFCRTIWPIFGPLMLYQYIRQIDEELAVVEKMFYASNQDSPEKYFNPNKISLLGHWRISQDLESLHKFINNYSNKGSLDTEA
ncbi:uncharacterized protein CMU_039640 [Cryptosporidium muris RN66]|uniref:Uncharacterized protein n=1 Tax=Cryptosporidium muris (strain RN66) TaxID=441375 RepID=B6A9K4_CRYMR|nr:uncharacterized protein CMU_039640 [Cryptosporidium muris RN66]EEA04895.1 hypothetical protein, conserved [Cryptosporidium muris RN66]|eukprot:XP_002139244.1 hypothetical protein [Cryptosporidium muris RN66]